MKQFGIHFFKTIAIIGEYWYSLLYFITLNVKHMKKIKCFVRNDILKRKIYYVIKNK